MRHGGRIPDHFPSPRNKARLETLSSNSSTVPKKLSVLEASGLITLPQLPHLRTGLCTLSGDLKVKIQ